MNEKTKELFEHTYTKDNFHRKVLLLEEFFEKYFFQEHEEGSIKEHLKHFLFDQNTGEYLRNSLLSLSDDFFAQFRRDTFRSILDSLKEEERTLPYLKIYVATLLPPVEVEKLGVWCRENVAPNIFLDLEVDSKVVGGCAFVWNGVYHDYSLAYYINKHKKEIRGLLAQK